MEFSAHADPQRGRDCQFVTTHWSLVLAAGNRDNEQSARALDTLCRAYWPPLYAYVRRRVSDMHEAQDLTQAFFERVLEKGYFSDANPDRGRFRAFLITSFKHFLSKEWDKAKALKRGGGHASIALDFASQDGTWSPLQDRLTPERIYERKWALTLLNRVMGRLQREMERSGKGRQFQLLKDFIGGSEATSYATVTEVLSVTEPAARMAASRMRARYRELLREEIAQTVASEDDIDDELRQLFETFAE